MRYRLGVDVGGTFTDVLLIDEDTGRTFRAKTPSTPHDPSVGVLAGMRAGLRRLAASGVEALAVSLINSYVNGAHERRVAEIAARELPGVPVSISSSVLPEMREYERTISTVANGYVQPQVARYMDSLATKITEISGGEAGDGLYILRSDGGLAGAATAARNPVSLLLSGPAGGVTGASWAASQAGFSDLLTFDMGGTSTDVALVQDGIARIGRETSIGDLTVRAASVDVRTVGAGGGSIAHVPDLTRALRVGPQSAGAEPGPAAYAMGGAEPTVTDANVVLGNLPAELAGGEITLDREAARAAVATVAEAMGLPSVEAAAQGIIDIVNENMFGALRLVSVQQGFDPRDFALVAFGGAGPLHANALGRLTGAWPVIIPPSPDIADAVERTGVLGGLGLRERDGFSKGACSPQCDPLLVGSRFRVDEQTANAEPAGRVIFVS